VTEIPVQADSPSAATEPFIVTVAGDSPVSWHPERGWMCEEHAVQPCEHTADLEPAKHPEWNQ
jgi:hypothetical protein